MQKLIQFLADGWGAEGWLRNLKLLLLYLRNSSEPSTSTHVRMNAHTRIFKSVYKKENPSHQKRSNKNQSTLDASIHIY